MHSKPAKILFIPLLSQYARPVSAGKLLSRPPDRGRVERGFASGSEGVWSIVSNPRCIMRATSSRVMEFFFADDFIT